MNAIAPEPIATDAAPAPVIGLKRILVPVDFSDCSKKALQYAKPFAEQFHAELLLAHVASLNFMTAEGFGGIDLPKLREDVTKDAEKRLGEILEVLDSE